MTQVSNLRVPPAMLIHYCTKNVFKKSAIVLDEHSLTSLLTQMTIQRCLDVAYSSMRNIALYRQTSICHRFQCDAGCGAGEQT